MPNVRRIDVLGSPVDVVSLRQTCELIREAVRDGSRMQIVTINVDFVMRARRDPRFLACLRQSDLVVADGVPVGWVARLQGQPLAGRVNGTELVGECARLAAELGLTLGLFGGEEDAAEGAAAVLRQRFPSSEVRVVAAPNPLAPEHDPPLVAAIRDQGIDVLLVALGSPKQEYWLERNLEATGAAVGIGIGGALDFISGRKPRAPAWMQRSGLEWLSRLLHEPRRLGRRYLIEDLPFVWIGLASAIRRRLRRGTR